MLELELNRAATAAPRHDELDLARVGRDAPPGLSLPCHRIPIVVDKCECERELIEIDLWNEALGIVGEVALAGEEGRTRSHVEGELQAIPREAEAARLRLLGVAEVERRHPVATPRQAEVPLGIFGRDVRAG